MLKQTLLVAPSLVAVLLAALLVRERAASAGHGESSTLPADAVARPQPPDRQPGLRHRQAPRVPNFEEHGETLPITVDWTTRPADGEGAPGAGVRTRFVRGEDRVVRHGPEGDVWTFWRNPLASEEVFTTRTVHDRRLVLDHEPADLEARDWPAHWSAVMKPMGPLADTGSLEPTGRSREAFGVTFAEYRPTGETGLLEELWWNDGQALALRAVWNREEGRLVQELTGLRWEADAAFLGSMEACLEAGYERMDLSDWREETHGTGQDHGHAGHHH